MRLKVTAATGAIALAVAVVIPASPARADSIRNSEWYLKTLKVDAAHAITTGDGVTVAVVDTGTYPHPDVRQNLLAGADFVPGEKGDGRDDQAGHGTQMAALVAGHGKASQNGVMGIAPSAKILPIKTSNDENKAPADAIGKGISWAVAEKAKVISVSAGVGPSFEVEDAVASALDADIVVVAAVGNTASNAVIGYPAAIDGVLAVGAVGRNGNYASLSLKDQRVQICAPGVDITTAEPRSKYVSVDGTSPAAAIASGAVALIRAKFPNLSAKEVIHRITSTADDIGPPGRDSECGFGVLNLIKALTADVPPIAKDSVSATSSATGSVPPGYIDPAVTTAPAQAEPKTEPASSSTPLVLGTLAGLVVAGGLIAFLVVRRRRNF